LSSFESSATNATVDLIPRALHRRRNRLVRLRLYAVLSSAIVAALGLFGLYASRLAAEVDDLNQITAKLRSAEGRLKAEGVALAAELSRTQTLLREAERLRDGHHWSRVLGYLAAQVPDTVQLVMVATDPPEPGRAGPIKRRARGSSRPKRSEREGPRSLAIRGYALDHKDLAAFIDGLKDGGVFDSVSLLHSKREPFLDGEGITFTLTCHW
jgi:Tfp pilus assembly protein PilN